MSSLSLSAQCADSGSDAIGKGPIGTVAHRVDLELQSTELDKSYRNVRIIAGIRHSQAFTFCTTITLMAYLLFPSTNMESRKHPRLPIGRTNSSSTIRTRFWSGYEAGNRQPTPTSTSLRVCPGLKILPDKLTMNYHNAGADDFFLKSMQLALSPKRTSRLKRFNPIAHFCRK
jgi:hypothetical protein